MKILETLEQYNPPKEMESEIVYAEMANPKFWETQGSMIRTSWGMIETILRFSADKSEADSLRDIVENLGLDEPETKLLYPSCGTDMTPFSVLDDRAHYTDRDKILIEALRELGVNADRVYNGKLPAYAREIEPNLLYLRRPTNITSQLIGKIPVDYVVSDSRIVKGFSDRELEKYVGSLILVVSHEGGLSIPTCGAEKEEIFSDTRQSSPEAPKMFVFQK